MLAALLALSPAVVAVSTQAASADVVEQLLQARGEAVSARFKVAVPQTDLRVSLDGFPVTPAMGLTSWLAFSPRGRAAAASGELVLLEDEVAPAQRLALACGFSMTALHNHLLRETPKVMIMRVEASGALEDLTSSAQKLLSGLQQARAGKGLQSGPSKTASSLEQAVLERILGRRAVAADGVLRFVFSKPEGAWLAFQGSMEKAAVSGDLGARAGEAAGLAAALTRGGLEVAAIHNQALSDDPPVYFLRLWGVGPAEALARALKTALDLTAPAESTK